MKLINKNLFLILLLFLFSLGVFHSLTLAQPQDRVEELIEKLKDKDKKIRKEAVDELAKLNWESLKGNCVTGNCHMIEDIEIKNAVETHKPAFKGKCRECHNTHGSEGRYYLIKENAELCFSCHWSMKKFIKEREYKHGPVKQGDCVACHDPHGSPYIKILKKAFTNTFYTSFEKDKYDLCFGCHKNSAPEFNLFTGSYSDFRNGNWNLHYVHVRRKKGLSCKVCHEVHASTQEKHMKKKIPFGKKGASVIFVKTPTGGKCIGGCHKIRAYDRENRVQKKEWF